jgi:hypothetical protein
LSASVFLTAAVGAALLIPAVPASTAAVPSVAPDLSGKWTLNKGQSEDARTKMREAGERRRGGGGFGGGGHGGFGGGGGGRGGFGGGRGGGRGGDGAGMRPDGERSGAMSSFFEPPETLNISRNGDEIAVNDGERIVILHPDGRKTKTDDGRTEMTAQWRGQELVVESKTERAKITTVYMAVPDKHQLDVTSRFEGSRGDPITARRVYDAAVPEAAATGEVKDAP